MRPEVVPPIAEALPSPRELRAQAREHRERALKTADPEQRRIRFDLAREYERLAEAIETERGAPPLAGHRPAS